MPRLSRTIPSAPQGFNKDQFFEGVYWHQRWQIFEGIFTPGINPIEQMCQEMNVPEDLTGKRVLDIGAWNGCLSFECERRGAREVIALGPEDPDRTGFYRIRDAIGATRTQYLPGSVYDLDPEKLGYFDVVMFCGVLYHLRYPLLGIDNIRRVCTGEVFVETIVSLAQLNMRQDDGCRNHTHGRSRAHPLVHAPLAVLPPRRVGYVVPNLQKNAGKGVPRKSALPQLRPLSEFLSGRRRTPKASRKTSSWRRRSRSYRQSPSHTAL